MLDLAGIAQQCEGAHRDKQGWRAKCPVHQGQSDTSLHLWEESDTLRVHCFSGCHNKDILDRLNIAPSKKGESPQDIYSYQNSQGYMVFQVVRLPGKKFRQRRPDLAHPGQYIWDMKGIPPILYRLPEVEQAILLRQPIYLVEGEKDVENLRNLGCVATCNRGGAGKWDDAYTEQLRNAFVVLLPDNDKPGQDHASLVTTRLRGAVRQLIRINLPDLPDHGDVSDWLAAGHTRSDLEALHAAEKPIIEAPHLIIERFADIPPEEVHWVWHPYLPEGKITILEGDPGQGKTYLMLAIASALTNGYTLPDQRGKPGPPSQAKQYVIYISAEDGLADTLVPRAIKAGADLQYLFGVRGVSTGGEPEPFSFAQLSLLSDTIRDTQAKLIIIDPIQAFLGASVDMHRANEVRPLMAALGRIAELHHCAILIIRHINKGTGKALYRGMGSIDFTAAARSVLVVAESLEDPNKKIVAQAKNSLAAVGASLVFSITDEGFSWCGASKINANDLVSQQPVKSQHQRNSAAEWLIETLRAEEGEMSATSIFAEAEANGINDVTLRRAKTMLRIISFRRGEKWYWKLPSTIDDDEIPF